MRAIVKGALDSSNREVLLWTREGMKRLWAQASLKGCFGYGLAVSDERHLAVCSVLPHCSLANKYVRS